MLRKRDISIVLGGEAGQGIQTVEHFLTRALKLSGYHVFATKEYMSRIRGGTNSTAIRVSSRRVASAVDRIDILVPLSRGAVTRLKKRITSRTVILADKEELSEELNQLDGVVIDLPLSRLAGRLGGPIYATTIAAGVVAAMFDVDKDILENYLRQRFAKKAEEIVNRNLEAVDKGYNIGRGIRRSGIFTGRVGKGRGVAGEILLNGGDAVALGSIAGGCNFISSYPMSPATTVLVFLARQAADFGIIVEQAEDEIAAVNMALGAWYAGARGMVTTSGGGFALMTEGLSLAGMIESPLVIHLAQRPGPATGLPTRTEQGDLYLALYAGHGEFPRVILAPGSVEKAFHLTRKAFQLADDYQVPVFVLTDQYLIDSYYNVPPFDMPGKRGGKKISKTTSAYKRYVITANGLSPRGVPGFGRGLVVADSDEHDEDGHLTEDLDMRVRMVDKRLKKLELIRQESIPPELVGKGNYHTLVVGWGSNYQVIREALRELVRSDVSFLHFDQVYPVHSSAGDYLQRAKRRVVIENNATSQFGNLLEGLYGLNFDHKVLKYNGLPFSVEEVVHNLETILGKKA